MTFMTRRFKVTDLHQLWKEYEMTKGTAVITGALGGIGAPYAEGLAKRGYDLLLVARQEKEAGEFARQIVSKTGRKVAALSHDLSDPKDLIKLETFLESNPDITLLANIAGAATFSPFSKIETVDIDQTIAINVTALTRLNHAVVPRFAQKGGGVIVNFASILAFHPWPELNVYNAAKSFVVSLSQALQSELRAKGVLVQVVSPSATATSFWEKAGFSHSNLPPSAVMSAEDVVQAALVGLDKREEWVMPSLANTTMWDNFQKARGDLVNGLMNGKLADRYGQFKHES
jgi:short-subunit dehydrogenase